ncbi:MAG TPA: TMEM175 family protein [Candidatus Acidoferrales bacterium]|nr:TMEM175 family protein [Candidatus Acidoferrales bacterium]
MEQETKHAAEKETGRLEAFSDGVYSIAMTLLVLDLRVPHVDGPGTPGELVRALAQQWPFYLAFVTSFFTILIMWVNHHAMFKLIGKVNRRLMFANGFLLMMTTVVPFTTGLVAEYLQKPGARYATAVYCASFVLISVGYNLTWHSAAHNRELIRSEVPDDAVRRITKNYRFGVPSYLVATACAFIAPALSMAIISFLWIFWSIAPGME